MEIKDCFKQIESSVVDHYSRNGLNAKALIEHDIDTSLGMKKTERLFEKFVKCIHNANWKAVSQTTFWKSREEIYSKVFHKYDETQSADLRVEDIFGKGLIKSKRKLQYCIDAAKFLVELRKTHNNDPIAFFDKYVGPNSTVYDRWGLVCILSSSINGIGTALACDFLKEIGYLQFGKPDVHIKRIFERIGFIEMLEEKLIHSNEDFFTFRILDYVASEVHETVFYVDKVLWLFATGFNTKEGTAIGGICKDKPDCIRCYLEKTCKHRKGNRNS